MSRSAINSADYEVPIEGFSQVIEVPSGGRTLYLSGLTSRTASGEIVCVGDMAGQARQVLDSMELILNAAGASLDHVVSIRTYVIDIEAYSQMDATWQQRWGSTWPASTLVQVSRLSDERQLIEIEAIAVVPQ